jgi:hypothetical protein
LPRVPNEVGARWRWQHNPFSPAGEIEGFEKMARSINERGHRRRPPLPWAYIALAVFIFSVAMFGLVTVATAIL